MLTTFLCVFAMLMIFALGDFASPRAKSVALCAAFGILLPMAAFRYMVPDYANYLDIFASTPSLGASGLAESYRTIHGEFGYLFLNSVVKTFGGSFIVVSTIVALVAIGANFFGISRLSPFPMLSVIYYFSHLYFNKELILARTGLASALVLLGIYAYINRKSLVALLLYIGSAALFHAAALIAVGMVAVFWARVRLNVLFWAVVLAFFFSILNFYPTDWFISALHQVNLLPTSVKNYIGYERYDYQLSPLNTKSVQQMIVIAVLYHYRVILISRLRGFEVLFATYMVSTLVLISFADFAILAARLATMLSNVEFILVPSLVLLVPHRERAFAYFFIVALSLSMLLLNLQSDRMPNYKNYLLESILELSPLHGCELCGRSNA